VASVGVAELAAGGIKDAVEAGDEHTGRDIVVKEFIDVG